MLEVPDTTAEMAYGFFGNIKTNRSQPTIYLVDSWRTNSELPPNYRRDLRISFTQMVTSRDQVFP